MDNNQTIYKQEDDTVITTRASSALCKLTKLEDDDVSFILKLSALHNWVRNSKYFMFPYIQGPGSKKLIYSPTLLQHSSFT